jgi:hypothetical protein
MSLLKYIKRLKRMDDLIRRKATGTPEEFAHKLGISRSQLLYHLKELRELDAPIEYSSIHQSYCYIDECSLNLTFKRGRAIHGGKNISIFSTVQFHWTHH